MRYIYILIDPFDNNIRYVGQSSNIERRLKDHINTSTNKNSYSYRTHKSCWIRRVIRNGQIPIVKIVEECNSLIESNIMERYYIEKYQKEGYKLTNSKSEDVTEFSIITKSKMSLAKKGKKLEEIVGKKKSIKLRKYYSERMSDNNPNRSNDPLVKDKISNTLKEYFKDKNNHWAYGKKMTADYNEKLRLSHINNPKNIGNTKPRTEEQKEKIRNKIKGTKIRRNKIIQYDDSMNYIKEWNSLREIERFDSTLNRSKISKSCKTGELYAGYIWKFKD